MKHIQTWVKKTMNRVGKRFQPMIMGVGHHKHHRQNTQYRELAHQGFQKNPIVYRCVSLIAKGISVVPWLLYKDNHEVDHHEILDILATPSPGQFGTAFIEEIVSQILIGGNAYIYKTKNKDGIPQLTCLRPERVKICVDDDGNLIGYEWRSGQNNIFAPVCSETGHCNVLHLKAFNPIDPHYGMSPLSAASLSVDQHNTVSEHNLALLENGGRPSGAFLVRPNCNAPPLSDQQRDALKQDLKQAYEGAGNAGRVLFLEGDFEWKEMGHSLKDLDFIDGKNLSSREIAQCFGVPPMLVGVPGDATFANYKEARFHLWEDTLLPMLNYLVESLNHWFVWEYGDAYALSYDMDSIPALSVRRETSWNKISTVDFLTINEKREAVGYGPLKDGDKL